MTSRIPPSRRDPGPDGLFALHRAAKALGQQIPGAGRVPGVAKAGVSDAVAAALRGKTTPPANPSEVVIPVLHGDPATMVEGLIWFDLDATC